MGHVRNIAGERCCYCRNHWSVHDLHRSYLRNLTTTCHRIEQRNAVATSLTRTFHDNKFSKAVALLHHLPDGVSAEELVRAGPQFEEAAAIVCTSFETMGLLVYRRIAPFERVIDLAGGMCASMYRKLEGWIDDNRNNQKQPSRAEWFE